MRFLDESKSLLYPSICICYISYINIIHIQIIYIHSTHFKLSKCLSSDSHVTLMFIHAMPGHTSGISVGALRVAGLALMQWQYLRYVHLHGGCRVKRFAVYINCSHLFPLVIYHHPPHPFIRSNSTSHWGRTWAVNTEKLLCRRRGTTGHNWLISTTTYNYETIMEFRVCNKWKKQFKTKTTRTLRVGVNTIELMSSYKWEVYNLNQNTLMHDLR